MEPDAEEGTQQIRALADPMPSPSGTSERTNSLPVGTKMGNEKSDHDSLVTVRLSEPPSLHVNTAVPPSTLPMRKTSYAEYIPSDAVVETPEEQDDDSDSEIFEPETSARRQANLRAELGRMAMGSDDDEDESRSSSESDRVDWEKLQRTENMESKDQQTTASLLARLEQENAKIAKIQNNIKVKTSKKWESKESRPRPPSMAQLQKMVSGPTPPALRYSTFQQPPMTELEFYLALVKDPKQTAARLPTLLSNKIRRGIPPPLRGVVWQSMAGARDSALEELFERLTGESSPYEGVISKDLGRSFPGVDMFRDPDGDGQRMLGRVLKCFSLYDTKIGYCQGLAFLVGPLLMHMPDKQAFCVLVRLMENYDLRQCFVPDLSGLHVRIYQFRELLRQHLPILSSHLDDLQVEPAYVSQWFLSFFAVTCPLPMLFRIYDVIFAEGASETIMRVALSLMRKNQARILACSELEDVMHLLLSRGLWDCYNYNADEFVNDFVALSDTVTKERLAALEQGYREAKISSAANHCGATDAVQGSADVATAASRFLGRLWASSSTPKPTTLTIASSASGSTPASSTLNPALGATSRPLSMLRRSTSKQSIASTLNSMEAVSSSNTSSAASVLSSVSTEATSVSRDSTTDDSPREGAPFRTLPKAVPGPPSGHSTSKDSSKHLHSQIEDLLTALSELQRNHALLASQLQKEKEEREEDRCAVRSLLDGLRSRASGEGSLLSTEETQSEYASNGPATSEATDRPVKSTTEQLSVLLDAVEMRFTEPAVRRRSSTSQTKSQLRDELARTKEQLSQERAKSRHFDRKLQEMEQEMVSLREQLRESHTHVRNVHQEKQRLEKQIHVMRIRASDTPPSAEQTEWFPKPPGATGLRELKLGRSMSTPSQAPLPYNKRISSATMQKRASREALAATSGPSSEQDALVLELVQAKTAEAVARQEAEEMKQKLEQLRKAFGLALGDTPPASQNSSAATGTSAAAAAMGMFGRLTGSTAPVPASDSPAKASTAPANNASSGGFWGWRR